MLRTAAAKIAWVGRTASMVFGLALVMALVFGVATMAFGANGSNFILGNLNNTATALTKLTGNVNGSAMQVVNSNADANDTALDLRVQAGEAPMRVNSPTKVANLNADKVDGRDAPMWAVVNADGSIPRSSDAAITSFQTGNFGHYNIQFPRDVSACAYQATLSEISFDTAGEIAVFRSNLSTNIEVATYTGDGVRANARFHLTVNC
jgi:hypothetical protein